MELHICVYMPSELCVWCVIVCVVWVCSVLFWGLNVRTTARN